MPSPKKILAFQKKVIPKMQNVGPKIPLLAGFGEKIQLLGTHKILCRKFSAACQKIEASCHWRA